MIVDSIFVELSVILVIALAISLIVRAMKQPPIIGYILAGIIVSPYFLNLVKSAESMGAFAHMGVAVLLFMVGLNLNPKVIKEVGKVALLTGIGQIVFTSLIGFGIAKLFGFSTLTSVYIAVALTFSSTIIIMKILSDRGDTYTLYGKIAIGFLIVQDLVAILALMIISSMSGGGDLSSIAIQKLGIGAGLVAALFVLGVYVLPPVTKLIAKSQELLLLFSIAWAFALASLFGYVGFSIEIGALLAGISLSVSPYRYEISAKMKPLRDFFLLLFFILLGSQLTFGSVGDYIWPVIIFSAFVLIGNPIIVMFLMGRLGYTKRNGFLAGLTVSQISEFSFILIALGVSVGHVSIEILSVVTLVGLVTMAGSTYAMMHGQGIYRRLSKALSIFERKGRKVDEGKYHKNEDYDILLFGYNRIGYSLEKSFKKLKKKFLVVDNNPETILNLAKARVSCRYGDAEDTELLEDLPMKKAKMVISTIPELETNLLLIKKTKAVNSNAIIIVVSHQIEDSLQLYEAGATYVITPHFFGGIHTAHLIEKYGFSRKDFVKEGSKNALDLLKRQMEGHRDVLHERD
ncbi:MAG: cation:proton antiporter [Nanoarchaeota archaeon]|nr:cation:proton antiporter [Nanoarchaeota archaeon]MBU1051099.1 cation:proton antiporter [Nanoarchaeota archaeon]MBU1987955.1 cation:proton antiporter [Nanoarchaeota archaeon]